MVQFLWLMLCGAIIGVADVIPGVSGGTMAVVLNIYDELIDAVGNFFKNWKKNVRFLIPFGIGAGLAIIIFGKLIKFLLENYPMQVNFFFLGLILGSIPLISKKSLAGGIKVPGVVALLGGAGVMVAIFLLSPAESAGLITTLTPYYFFLLVVTSFVAAIAMIVPGISGSMMLLIFGVYYSVIGAVSDLNILVLIPVAIGVLAGLLLGAKLIAVCLKKFPQITYCVIFGLIIGSLFPVIRNAGFTFSLTGLISILLMLVGAVTAYLMSREKPEIAK